MLEKKYELKEGVEPVPKDGSVTKEMREFDEEDLQPSVSLVLLSPVADWADPNSLRLSTGDQKTTIL